MDDKDDNDDSDNSDISESNTPLCCDVGLSEKLFASGYLVDHGNRGSSCRS